MNLSNSGAYMTLQEVCAEVSHAVGWPCTIDLGSEVPDNPYLIPGWTFKAAWVSADGPQEYLRRISYQERAESTPRQIFDRILEDLKALPK